MDAMSRTLRRIAQSPFSKEIKCTEMPKHFMHPSFTCYDGNTDPVEHVSHYTYLIALYSQNDRLLCKVFPSSFGPMMMRWFNGLRKGSVHNFGELIQALYNEIKGCNEQVVASTFRLGLPQESELRDSMTIKPLENMH